MYLVNIETHCQKLSSRTTPKQVSRSSAASRNELEPPDRTSLFGAALRHLASLLHLLEPHEAAPGTPGSSEKEDVVLKNPETTEAHSTPQLLRLGNSC